MGRHVNQSFILFLIRKFNLDRQNHSQFCKCYCCRRLINLNRKLGKWNFYDLNKDRDKWFIFFIKKMVMKLLFFQFLFDKKTSNNLNKYIIVKYFAESEYAKVPYQATEGAAGYDLFPAETKTLLPKSTDTISSDLRWAIPSGFYGKVFPRSGIVKEHFVTIDAGVIDSDFRGIIQVLLVNHHHEKTFTVRAEDRIAQVVFMEKFSVNFHKVSDPALLGKTKHGHDGFGSTGVEVIKKVKQSERVIEMITSEGDQVTVNPEDNFQIFSEKTKDDLQIT